jgi:putative inorganic carbon (HCO3(-)) transporter
MFSKNKIFLGCDLAIVFCLSLALFLLPFLKAGIEVCVWFALFLLILKRALGYRSSKGPGAGLLPETDLNRFLGYFLLANAVSVVLSVNYGLSVRGFFGKELKFVGLYFMIVEVVRNRKRLLILLIAFISSAVLLIADAGVQYFKGFDFIKGNVLTRLYASFNNPTGFATWLIVAIPLFCGLMAEKGLLGKKGRIPLFLLILSSLACLLLTFSRGAWLGLIIGGFLMLGYALKNLGLRTRMLLFILLLSLGAFFAFMPDFAKSGIHAIGELNFKSRHTVSERVTSIVKTGDGSWSIRIHLWKESLRIIKDFPWTGCGLNTYARTAPLYKMSQEGGIYPHNSFLQKTAETGLLGLVAFLAVLGAFFRKGFRYLGENNAPFVLGLLSGIFSFLVSSFFDNHFYSLQLVVLFWFMMGLTVAVMDLEDRGRLKI